MNETARILCAIGTTDRVYADQFVKNLGDPISFPELFALIKTLEEQRLVTTVRSGHDGLISLNLTELGAERAREVMEGAKQ
jgi:DNA-binding PadR family transcriptional regulator